MDRRKFINLGVGATVATMAAPVLAETAKPAYPAVLKGEKLLKMVTTWPKNFPGTGSAAERIAKRIEALSDGKIKVKVYAAGELVPALEAFGAVSEGNAHMYHGASYYWQGKSKAFNFFASVPFGLTSVEMDAWINHAGGQDLWDDLAAQFNIKSLPAGNTGVQMGGWYNKEINSIEDLKALKIRMPGIGGQVMNELGAIPVTLPGGEIFPALQSGAIDATEWIGPWNDLAFGFYKVAKHYYYPGFHEPGTTLDLGINKEFWDRLTKAERYMIQTAAAVENHYTSTEFFAKNAQALDILRNKYGVRPKAFHQDILKTAKEAAEDTLKALGNEDALTKKIYSSFMDFKKQSENWMSISETAYNQAR